MDEKPEEQTGATLMNNIVQFTGKSKKPSDDKLVLLTLDEAFRGVVIAWIQLRDTKLADKLFGYVVEGYNNSTYVIHIPEKYWTPVKEEILQTLTRIRQEAKDMFQTPDD